MKVQLDTNAIKTISLFQNLTGAHAIDFIENDDLYFVVPENEYGLAVGKNGVKIRNAENVFKKSIKIFEYSPDLEKFIKHMVPEAQEISIQDKKVEVRIKPSDRAYVIGKGGSKAKIIEILLKRLHDIESFKVK